VQEDGLGAFRVCCDEGVAGLAHLFAGVAGLEEVPSVARTWCIILIRPFLEIVVIYQLEKLLVLSGSPPLVGSLSAA